MVFTIRVLGSIGPQSRVAEQYTGWRFPEMWKTGAVTTKLEVTIPNPTYLYYLVLSCTILYYLVLSCTILYYLVLSCTILYYLVLSCTWMYLVHSCEKESLVIIPHGASFLGLYSCRRICSKFYKTWLNPGTSFHPPSWNMTKSYPLVNWRRPCK